MFTIMTLIRAPMQVVLVFLSFMCLARGSCSFQSTGETLNDCQWSKWCWMCDDCGKPGDSGTVMQLRGTCCEAPNEATGDCATHCGIPTETDFSMTNFTTCAVSCQDKSAPSVCQSLNSGSGVGTTPQPTPLTTKVTISTTTTTATSPTTTAAAAATTTATMVSTTGSPVVSSQISVDVYGDSDSGSGGAIAGGVVAGILLVSGVAGLAFYFLVYRKKLINASIQPGTDKATP